MQKKSKRYYSTDRVRKSLIHYLFGRGTASLASFASAILLIRVFSVTTYAAFTALSGLFFFITIVSNGGMERVILRFLPELRQKGAERTIRTFAFSFFILRTVLVLCLLIPLYFFSSIIIEYLSIAQGDDAIFSFCVYALSKIWAEQFGLVLQSMLYQREATIGTLIEFVTRLVVIVLYMLQVQPISLDTVYWIFSASCGLRGLYSVFKLSKYVGKFDSVTVQMPLTRLFGVGWNNYLYSLIGFPVSAGAGRILAATYLGNFQTAILGFSYTLVDVMMRHLPAILLIGLIEPVFMARYTEDRNFENLNQMASVVLKINLFIMAPVTAWVAFEGSPLISAISGGKYADATLPIAALMATAMIHSHQLVLALIINAVEESRLLAGSSLRALLLLPVYLGLIIGLGLGGLLAGYAFLAFFRNFYMVSKLRRIGYPYRLDWLRMTRIIIASLGSALIASNFDLGINEFADSIVKASITGVLYLIVIYFWKAFSQSERDLLNRFAGRKIFVW